MKLRVNGDVREVAAPCTLERLIAELGFTGRRLAVEMNGEIVPRGDYAARELHDGDQLEIVQAIGGGEGKSREQARSYKRLAGASLLATLIGIDGHDFSGS